MSAGLLAAAGGLVAAGLWMAAYGSRRLSLVERLSPVVPAPRPQEAAVGDTGWAYRLGAPLRRGLARVGLPGPGMRRVLATADIAVEEYRAEKATATGAAIVVGGLVGFFGPLVMPSAPVGWGFALLMGAGCFLAPDVAARGRAAECRAELRSATAVLADLTAMGLASGLGPVGALKGALERARGKNPQRIRLAVRASELRHQPHWEGLAGLGAQTGVRELEELAASLRLGGSGARTRNSLAAKAASLRVRQAAEAEADAHAATERMALPTMGLVAGFLVLVCFIALTHVMAGF
ncbi:hypothetical protein [Nocardiopsis protaetiae]|uniref:hypothetical protein n=1 Tax=Nocardiopsis protaetiae TaxID=3382270 RepID=UPI00387AA438